MAYVLDRPFRHRNAKLGFTQVTKRDWSKSMLIEVNPNELLTPPEVEKQYGIDAGTLAVWRCTRRYALAYIKVGRMIRYRRRDIEAFLESRTVRPLEMQTA